MIYNRKILLTGSWHANWQRLVLLTLSMFALLALSTQQTQAQTFFDTPLTTYQTYTGTLDVAIAGISLFPNLTGNTFNITIPQCAGGIAPTITAAYLSGYTRWRSLPNDTTTPTFDDAIDVSIGGSPVQSLSVTDAFFSVLPAGSDRIYHRQYALFEATALFSANFTAGAPTTIAITDFTTPPETGFNAENYGVGLAVVYECAEFENVTIEYQAGLDWFFEGLASEPYIGRYSDLLCLTFPAAASGRDFELNAIVGGQAAVAPPYRGNRLWYLTGTGTPPVETANPPSGVVATDPSTIEIGPRDTIWTSSLGQEWDLVERTIAIPAGSTFVCLQAESDRNPNETDPNVLGFSGDLLAPFFTLPPADAPTPTPTPTPTPAPTLPPTPGTPLTPSSPASGPPASVAPPGDPLASVQELPATGETPAWRDPLLALLFLVTGAGLAGALTWRVRRSSLRD